MEKKQDLKESQNLLEITTESKTLKVIERPLICCLDLDNKTIQRLKECGANIFEGTLGSKESVPNNQRNSEHHLLLNFTFPSNLHEFDIVILNLENSNIKEWNASNHKKDYVTGNTSQYIVSKYPETLFDPRPIACLTLKRKLADIKRNFLVIAFSTPYYELSYESISIDNSSYHPERERFTTNIYSFWHDVPLSDSLTGKEIKISDIQNVTLLALLDRYKNNSIYHQTFYHPTNWDNTNRENVKDDLFIPLMTNLHEDIVSFAKFSKNGNLFMFPQFEDKAGFLIDFLTNFAPSIFPDIFPFSSTFSWTEENNYWLPNHSKLLEDKAKLKEAYENKIEEINLQISDNQAKYLFLHKMLTESDDLLVESIIDLLKWLGFESVIAFDEAKKSKINEEDIQVDLGVDGLLVIECKGIGGTSKDSDCSQISKIKHRRCEERNKFDVYALYIVNHQRYLPPLKRKNPPFTSHQIQDAKNDKRGLLTTWQFFNLFFDVEQGIITKEEARKAILSFGLVDFRPQNLGLVDKPTEIFKEGTVCIVNLSDEVLLNTNEILFVERNGKFNLTKINEIRKDDQKQLSATNGEFGLKLDSPIKKDSILWKKNNN